MAVSQTSALADRRCPECGGQLEANHRSWQCRDCAHVPRHGAD